ncbi:ImcF-related family protein [Aliiglaciecola sp. 3_MG-2023]|uniref:ImcF-related family protein n=1 Tax=Aliiglaciecola sp. 3_MG-2023 TaxID=3062644 RepID=UPI0026E1826B|nr:ImcF-related family protein [Aliiglaciecola sp. 3_MG-2023]MDO6694977.1 ImcF-related family protein [Aliiglaciecola sp. 3_MG-2023]
MNQLNSAKLQCQYLYQHFAELQNLLTAKGIVIGPDRWLAANDLLLHLQHKNHPPVSANELRNLLGPLFCRSEQEQNLFKELFDIWALEKQADLDKSEVVLPDSITLTSPDPKPFYSKISFWTVIFISCVIILLNLEEPPPPPPGSDVTIRTTAPDVIEDLSPEQQPCENSPDGCATVEESTTSDTITPEIVKPASFRYTPEPIRLNPEELYDISRWQYVVITVPLLLWLVIRIYTRVNRRYVLRQENNQRGNPLVYLKLKTTETMPFALADFSSLLRLSILRSTRKLDADKTIIATIRNAGLFKPTFQQRYVQPEYLVLIDRSHINDQCAALADSLLVRLQLEHLHIRAFHFQGDPSWCFEKNTSHAISLQSLAHKYPDSRLIVISSGHKLVNRLSGELAKWVSLFKAWKQRVWLTNQPQPWGYALSQIAFSGFAVAPLETAGVKASAQWFSKLQTDNPNKSGVWYSGYLQQKFPVQLKDASFWLENDAEKAHKKRLPKLLEQLREYLHEDGMLLLGCVAAYPEINGNLSIALEQKLFPDAHPIEREQRLLKLSALPWSQQGQMPTYVRAVLLDELSKDEFQRIGYIYRNLFELASTPKHGLGIQVPGDVNTSDSPKPFKSHSYPTSDPLMIRALRGWRSRLDFILPNKLARKFGQITQSSCFGYLSFSLVLLVSLFLWFSWPYYLSYQEQQRINDKYTDNIQTGIIIETDPTNMQFSEALNRNLERWGFKFYKTNIDEQPFIGKGQIITDDLAVAEQIQARIDYLTNDQLKLQFVLVNAKQTKLPIEMLDDASNLVNRVVRIRLPTEVAQNPLLTSSEQYTQEWYRQRDFVFNLLQENQDDEAAYNDILITELLPRLEHLIAGNLNWLLRNNAQEQQVTIYETLKAYLMLQNTSRFDAGYLRSWLATTLRNEGVNMQMITLSYFDDLLNLELKQQSLDQALVATAREALLRMPLAQRIYSQLKATEENRKVYSLYDYLVAEKITLFELNEIVQRKLTIPILFTESGYKNINFSYLISQGKSEQWVLSDAADTLSDADLAKLEYEIKQLYAQEYIATWQSILSSLQIKNFSQYADELNALAELKIRQKSDIFKLLKLVYRHTQFSSTNYTGADYDQAMQVQQSSSSKLQSALKALEPPNVLANSIEQQFSELHELFVNEAAYMINIGEPIARIEEALIQIYTSNSPNKAAFTNIKEGYDGRGISFSAYNQFRARNLPAPIDKWLISITDNATRDVFYRARIHINQKWQENVLAVYRKNIVNHYPFNKRAKQDVSYADLVALFGPNSAYQSFENEYVAPFVDNVDNRVVNRIVAGMSMDFSQEFFVSYERLSKWFEFLTLIEKDGRVIIDYRPVTLTSNSKQFTLEFNGQRLTYAHGPQRQQKIALYFPFYSQNQKTDDIRYAFNSISKESSSTKSFVGDWAWFRFLQDNKMQFTRSSEMVRLVISSKNDKIDQQMVLDLNFQESSSEFIVGKLFENVSLPQNVFQTEE